MTATKQLTASNTPQDSTPQDGQQNAFCDLNPRLRRALNARLERRLVNLISYAVHVGKPLYLGMASARQEPELAILDKLLSEYNFALTWHNSGEDTLVFLEPQRQVHLFSGATVRAVPAASVPATFTFHKHADTTSIEQDMPLATSPTMPRANYEKAV
jgi:hypothetical protein